jgi:hypothetical protein
LSLTKKLLCAWTINPFGGTAPLNSDVDTPHMMIVLPSTEGGCGGAAVTAVKTPNGTSATITAKASFVYRCIFVSYHVEPDLLLTFSI